MTRLVPIVSLALMVALTGAFTGCKTCRGAGEPDQSPEALLEKAKDDEGYKPVFKDDLSNAVMEEGAWTYKDGVLTAMGHGDIWTQERYGDFILELEFKCAPETNSGVFIRTGDLKEWLHTAIEVQVLQPNDKYDNPKHHCGGIFDVLEPSKQMVKEPGEWNHYYIIAKGKKIYVWLNGEQVVDMDLNRWTEPHKNPDGTRNKFRYAYNDMPMEGHLGLQYHGHPVWYRNIRIKPLD